MIRRNEYEVNVCVRYTRFVLLCPKTVEAYREEKAEKLILLGDILYHGPRNDLPKDYAPKKVIELLNGIKNEILCVRGNCDTEVDQWCLNFPSLLIMRLYSLTERPCI